MLIKVKNLHGTAERVPDGFASWKDFWEKKSGRRWPTYCAASGCYGEAAVGAHVKKVGGFDNRWYIVPLCYAHNNDLDGEFWVDSSYLVPISD